MVCGRITLFCDSAWHQQPTVHYLPSPAQQHKIIFPLDCTHYVGAILWAERHKKYFFIFYRNTSKCIKITNFTHVLPLQYNSDQHPWILRGNPALTPCGLVAGCLGASHNIYNIYTISTIYHLQQVQVHGRLGQDQTRLGRGVLLRCLPSCVNTFKIALENSQRSNNSVQRPHILRRPQVASQSVGVMNRNRGEPRNFTENCSMASCTR